MKRISIALFVLSASLLQPTVALADTDFTVSFSGYSLGNQMTFSGTFNTTPLGNGRFQINGITGGIFTDNNGSLNISGAATLIPITAGTPSTTTPVNGALGPSFQSPDGSELFDDLLQYPANPDYLDGFGFLFSVGGMYEVCIGQSLNPADSTIYGAWVSKLGSNNSWVDTGPNFNYGEPIDFTAAEVIHESGSLSPAPEPSSLLLLGTGLAGFASLMWRKKRT